MKPYLSAAGFWKRTLSTYVCTYMYLPTYELIGNRDSNADVNHLVAEGRY
jgi:hypothetical protein